MQVRQDDPAMAQDQAAALGQHDTLALMLEQRQASLPFHLLDLHRYRWLRQVQVLGGAGKTQVPRHTFKNLNLANGDMSHEAMSPMTNQTTSTKSCSFAQA